jgi:hypothetical protein
MRSGPVKAGGGLGRNQTQLNWFLNESQEGVAEILDSVLASSRPLRGDRKLAGWQIHWQSEVSSPGSW